ncbi:MAG: glycosyltransferase family 4 protein [Vulcanimicrobiota bacterium]
MIEGLSQVAFVGNYLPRKCGIATFTSDLCRNTASSFPKTRCSVVSVTDNPGYYDFGPEVVFEMEEQDLHSYRRAADHLNNQGPDAVCLQHEFGVYGGPSGSHILALLEQLEAPVVTTMHTILKNPTPTQERVTHELIRLSQRLVVMSRQMERMLIDLYQVEPSKIDRIHHGIPDIDPNSTDLKERFPKLSGRRLILTFGLLSPGKGIEHALRALPRVIEAHPDILYLVVGATHPNLVKEQGESYRSFLEDLTRELGLERHVQFENRFLELDELKDFIAAAEIYVTPYTNEAQAVSSTLAYAFGCGIPVISTPYWHARELLGNGDGILVPFGDSAAICTALSELLADDEKRLSMGRRAYLQGRDMVWSRVVGRYLESFKKAREEKTSARLARQVIPSANGKPAKLPELKLDHLLRMTDSTGVFQHASYTVPNFSHGYCTDDNARGLMLTYFLEEMGASRGTAEQLRSTYSAFLAHAFNRVSGRFRNFMSFERRWLEEVGSADSHGRAVWALGMAIRHTPSGHCSTLNRQLFLDALPAVSDFSSLRSVAFSLLGVVEYLFRFAGDREVTQVSHQLAERLHASFRSNAVPRWSWFEDFLSYDNPRLAQALIACGRQSRQKYVLEAGLEALEWLVDLQGSDLHHLKPVGSDFVFRKGQEKPKYDQQPVEIWATLSACLEAFRATSSLVWYTRAVQAFEWFIGRNDLGLSVYDSTTGGCRDGLHPHRLNQNQGAESSLSFLLSLAEVRNAQRTMSLLKMPTVLEPVWQTR